MTPRAFEGTGNPYPLAFFRLAFYAGLALHFLPVVAAFEENFGADAFRIAGFNDALYALDAPTRVLLARILGVSALTGIGAGMIAYHPRTAAAVAYGSLYGLTSLNSFNVHTLALGNAWAILGLFCILRCGDEVLSVGRSDGSVTKSTPSSRLAGLAVCGVLLLTLFFSGVEKIFAGWPFHGAMARLLRYPDATILRPWAVGAAGSDTGMLGYLMECATLVVELGVPVAMVLRRFTRAAATLHGLFFAAITLSLEVPPLFSILYLACVPLLLEHSRRADPAPAEHDEAHEERRHGEPGPAAIAQDRQ